jgi:hypothetical protein
MDCMRLVVIVTVLVGEAATAQSPPPMEHPAPLTHEIVGRREFPMEFIRNQCLEFTEVKRGIAPGNFHDCRVSEFGEFGSADGQAYYYALYCLIPNYATDKGECNDGSLNARYHQHRGLAVFVHDASSSKARLLFERVAGEIGSTIYEQPRIIKATTGTLLYLPIESNGTGHFNESEYFLRNRGAWEPVDAQGWLEDLRRRIPAGLEIWKGVWPNPETMKAVANLYHSGDANCCPTGGTARIGLAIRSRRLVIESLVVEKDQ